MSTRADDPVGSTGPGGRPPADPEDAAPASPWSWALATYGEEIAPIYDELYASVNPDMIDTLAMLATDTTRPTPEAAPGDAGPHPGTGTAPSVLELGIGTGRVALPLAARGIAVHGVDASEAMIATLRAKPGGAAIPVTIGDFGKLDLKPQTFDVVFVVFNTFFALTTQEAQIACFEAVSRHLSPGGCFVLETFVPDVARFDRGQRTSTTELGTNRVLLEAAIHDGAAQLVRAQHILVTPERTRLYPVELRYAWPSEMDLMARLAGLTLRDRWSSWTRAAFTARSETQVVVYETGR